MLRCTRRVAEGDESKYATFEDALNRYEQLNKWLESFSVINL